jgi:tetraacyldisaccharide 4'-kinase
VLVVAGLARPEGFFAAVAGEGWTVADQLAFPDHHRYGREDLDRIVAAMRSARAVMVLTTEKDLVRMLPLRPLPVPVAWVPLLASIEPAEEFGAWLVGRLRAQGGGWAASRPS